MTEKQPTYHPEPDTQTSTSTSPPRKTRLDEFAKLPTDDGFAWIHPEEVQAFYDDWPPDSDPPASCYVIVGHHRVHILTKAEKAHDILREQAFRNFVLDPQSAGPTGTEGIPAPGLPGDLDLDDLDRVFAEGATVEAS